MADRQTFTHPSKRGEDQRTNFIHVGYSDTLMDGKEQALAQIKTESVSRGEDRFKSFPCAK